MIEVVAPDGSVHEFPEDTQPGVIARVMEQYGGPRRKKQGRGTSAALAVADGVSFGFSDEMAGGLTTLLAAQPGRLGAEMGAALRRGEGLDGALGAARRTVGNAREAGARVEDSLFRAQQTAKQDNQWTYTLAGLAGGVAAGVATGGLGAAARGAVGASRGGMMAGRFAQPAMNIGARLVPAAVKPVAQAAAGGAAYGSLYGAGSSAAGERLDGARGGALLGAAGGVVAGSAVGLLGRPLGNAVDAITARVRAMTAPRAAPQSMASALGEGADVLGAKAGEAVGTAPASTAKEARALAERFGVPLTVGQQMRAGSLADLPAATRQQMFERDAASGMMGAPAQQVMTPFFGEQGRRLSAAARRISGGADADAATPVLDRMSNAAELVRAALERADDAMAARRDEAYGVFRTTAAQLDSADLASLPAAVRARVRGDGLPPEAPAWDSELPSFASSAAGQAINVLERDVASLVSRGGATPAQIEQMRRQMIAIGERLRPEQREEMAGLMRVRDAVDEWFGGQMARGISGGTAQEMAAMQGARALHAQYADVLRSSSAPVLRDLVNDGSRVISGTQLLSAVLGAGDRGLSAQGPRTIGQLDRVIKALGQGDEAAGRASPEFAALREAATDRVFRPLLDAVAAGNQPPIGLTIKLLDEALAGKGREIAQRLYTPDELASMREFRRLLALVNPIDGTVKSSGTAERLTRALGAASQSIPGLGPIWNALLRSATTGAGEQMAAGRAAAATTGRARDASWLQKLFAEGQASRAIERTLGAPVGWATTSAPSPFEEYE